MLTADDYALRAPRQEDLNFILNSFLRSQRDIGDNALIAQDAYYSTAGAKAKIVGILQHAEVLVACNPDDPDQIYGYCVYDRPATLHAVYCKQFMRGNGLATLLVEHCLPDFGSTPTKVTSLCRDYRRRAEKHRLTYDPYPQERQHE